MATTLIEVIGTLSVLLVLAVSAASILASITEIGAQNNRARQGRVSIQRLADVFRQDVHRARQVELANDQWLVQLTTDVATIRYEWDEMRKSIGRIASDGPTRLSVDRFRLTDRCIPEVTSQDGIVSLVLRRGRAADGKPFRHPWVIEARQ